MEFREFVSTSDGVPGCFHHESLKDPARGFSSLASMIVDTDGIDIQVCPARSREC